MLIRQLTNYDLNHFVSNLAGYFNELATNFRAHLLDQDSMRVKHSGILLCSEYAHLSFLLDRLKYLVPFVWKTLLELCVRFFDIVDAAVCSSKEASKIVLIGLFVRPGKDFNKGADKGGRFGLVLFYAVKHLLISFEFLLNF